VTREDKEEVTAVIVALEELKKESGNKKRTNNKAPSCLGAVPVSLDRQREHRFVSSRPAGSQQAMSSIGPSSDEVHDSKEADQDFEECPICCYELSVSDQLYALRCNSSCKFNYCYRCIEMMQKSVAQASRQISLGANNRNNVEITMLCPNCRGRYHSSKFPCDAIVGAVLSLREAHAMQELFSENDSALSASDLGRKDWFVKSKVVEDLEESAKNLDEYHKEHGMREAIPCLDWALLREKMVKRRDADGLLALKNSFRDPTLFLGVSEKLMSLDEQEYVTELFTSGQAELVARGTLIVHGMIQIQYNEEQNEALTSTVRQISNFLGASSYTSFCSARTLQQTCIIRSRYPLPNHMPRCVSLPIPEPGDTSSSSIFNFAKDKLVLRGVRGPAGFSGLRRGDVVTHLNGEKVVTQQDVQNALQQAYRSDFLTALVVVNADERTSKELQDRALRMKQDGLKL